MRLQVEAHATIWKPSCYFFGFLGYVIPNFFRDPRCLTQDDGFKKAEFYTVIPLFPVILSCVCTLITVSASKY
jgi:hypothetical protein